MESKKPNARLTTAVKIGKVARGVLRKTQSFPEHRHNASAGPIDFDQIGVEPMLLALSMELALKAWFVFDHNNPKVPKTHNLVTLFEALLPDSQAWLDLEFKNTVVPDHPNFFHADYSLRHMLYQHQNAFIDWRYHYERPRNISLDRSGFTATVEMTLTEFETRYYEIPAGPSFSTS